MPLMTIYKDASITVEVIDGVAPVDQTPLVTSLTAQVATLTTSLATRTSERDALTAKIVAARLALA